MTKLEVNGKILATVFLLAFALRLISLNQSLWLDEATTARAISTHSFTTLISQFSIHDFHPPLFYLVLKMWSGIFGTSEMVLRFPSVIFSLLAGWAVFLIGRELKSRKVGLYAAIFFLFNPLVVYYSQEARMYMMVTALLSFGTYFVLRILKQKKKDTQKRDLILANIFFGLSLFTFYGSLFYIAAVYFYLLLKKEARRLLLLLPGFAVALLVLSPLLQVQLSNSKDLLQTIPNWVELLGKANLKDLVLIPVKFTMGRVTFEPKPLYFTVALLWVAYIFYVAFRKARQYQFLLVLFIAPVLFGFLFSFYKPLLQYFRFIYLIVPLSLLVALGSQNRPQRVRILAGFFFFSCVYLFYPGFHREDWKTLTKDLKTHESVYMIPSSADPVLYYKNVQIKDIRTPAKKENDLTVIPYTVDIYGFDYQASLTGEGFRQTDVRTERGVSVEHWIR